MHHEAHIYSYQHITNDALLFQSTTLASGSFEVQLKDLLAVCTNPGALMP